MPFFTIEATYRIPVYRQRTYEADTVEQACRLAIEDDDWSDQKEDFESSGETYVTGAWPGPDSAYRVTALPVPSQFGETVQRKADHFETLLGTSEGPRARAGWRGVRSAVLAPARRRGDRQGRGDPRRRARSGLSVRRAVASPRFHPSRPAVAPGLFISGDPLWPTTSNRPLFSRPSRPPT